MFHRWPMAAQGSPGSYRPVPRTLVRDEGRAVRLEVACLPLSPMGLTPKGHFSEDCPPFVLSRADLCPRASPAVSAILPSEPEPVCYDLGMALLAYRGTY